MYARCPISANPAELDLPVLMTLPIRYTKAELKKKRMGKVFVAASIGLGFVISTIAIVVSIKGVDLTMTYVKKVLDKI